MVSASELRIGSLLERRAALILKVAMARKGVTVPLGRREPALGRRSGLAVTGTALKSNPKIKILVKERWR